MNNIQKVFAAVALLTLVGCGTGVEVPPASVGKIMTKDGYQTPLIPTSKFRLAPCWSYCDRLVVLDVADNAYTEPMNIFIPTDKLNLQVQLKTTLSVNPKKTQELFAAISPVTLDSRNSEIQAVAVYNTYAQQIILSEARAYLSQYSISEIASSNEKINSDLQVKLSEAIEARTPFTVRYVGITGITYPKIITDAQEASAERREAIQQEEAQLAISKVKMDRELQEARMMRAIDKEKAETEALSQRILAESVDSRVLELRRLETQMAYIAKWNGVEPTTKLVSGTDVMLNTK